MWALRYVKKLRFPIDPLETGFGNKFEEWRKWMIAEKYLWKG
jgi:hypothetical protein